MRWYCKGPHELQERDFMCYNLDVLVRSFKEWRCSMKLALTILLIIASIGLIAGVLLQSSRSAGLSGAIAGGAETFFGKKRGIDHLLSRITTCFAVAFLGIALIIAVLGKL